MLHTRPSLLGNTTVFIHFTSHPKPWTLVDDKRLWLSDRSGLQRHAAEQLKAMQVEAIRRNETWRAVNVLAVPDWSLQVVLSIEKQCKEILSETS